MNGGKRNNQKYQMECFWKPFLRGETRQRLGTVCKICLAAVNEAAMSMGMLFK